MVSVRDLVNSLLDCDPNWDIEVRDKEGIKIPETKIVAVKSEDLCCLFG